MNEDQRRQEEAVFAKYLYLKDAYNELDAAKQEIELCRIEAEYDGVSLGEILGDAMSEDDICNHENSPLLSYHIIRQIPEEEIENFFRTYKKEYKAINHGL